MILSWLRSATGRFELAVLLFKLLHLAQLARSRPAVFLPPLANCQMRVASLMPILRHISSTFVPSSDYFSVYAICSSVNRLFLMACLLSNKVNHAEIATFNGSGILV
jgi:hypothetical protein